MKIYKRKTNEGHVSIFRFECVYEPISSKRMKNKLSQNLRLTHSQANVLSSVERITCTVYFGCFRSQRRRRQRREQRHTNWCANRLIFIFDIGYTLLWLFLLIMWSIRVYALLVFFFNCNPFIHNLLHGMEIKIKSCHFSWDRQAAVPSLSSSPSFGQIVRDKSRQHRRSLPAFFIGVWQLSIMMWWTIHANLLRATQNEKILRKRRNGEWEKKVNTNHLWIWCFFVTHFHIGWLQAKIWGFDDHYQNICPLSFERPHFLFLLPTRRPFARTDFYFIRTRRDYFGERSWQRSSFSLCVCRKIKWSYIQKISCFS